jgi:6-phosphofructokinase 1
MNFEIEKLGGCVFDSPLGLSTKDGDFVSNFISDDEKMIVNCSYTRLSFQIEAGEFPDYFELAGPRMHIFFDPASVKAAIVTCGGLCPGLNNVIRSLVFVLSYQYGVKDILGIKYGYWGMTPAMASLAIKLSPTVVENIHQYGGSFLASSRGNQRPREMVDYLMVQGINMLFIIGGDGTIRGGLDIIEECKKRNHPIAVIGIPKTIDNDIAFIDRSFGFMTAVDKAKEILGCAHTEAYGVYNGIGLVKLMGRFSGFIAARSAIASGEANFVLVPEVPFDLEGSHGFLHHLESRIQKRHHAVVVVAEGAGQRLLCEETTPMKTDASGNKCLEDIAQFLKFKITEYFSARKIPFALRYFDPSYIIRSIPANSVDSMYCSELAQNAIHAAFSGRTAMIVGLWNNQYVHIPMSFAISSRKMLNPDGQEWLSVIESTGQPYLMTNQE